MNSPLLILLSLIGSASSSKGAHGQSIKGAGVTRSLQVGVVLYTNKDDWKDAMEDQGFTVVENDLTPLIEGASAGEIELPKKTTTDVGKFDINLNDNSLENWIWKENGKDVAFEGLFNSNNGLKFENFDGGLACGFAGMWKQIEKNEADIIIKVNDDEVSITDNLKNGYTFIGIVVTEGFDGIEFLSPKKKIEFLLYDIFLSVECSTSSSFPSFNPTQAPSEIPSQAPSEIPSQAPSEIPPTLSPAPTSAPSTSTPSSKPTTSAPTVSPTKSPLGISELINAIVVRFLTGILEGDWVEGSESASEIITDLVEGISDYIADLFGSRKA